MKTKVLNYRVLVRPDVQTGTNKPGFTAFVPILGVADDGDTVEEAIENVQGAITAYIESLASDGLPIPLDAPEKDIVTTTQVSISKKFIPA